MEVRPIDANTLKQYFSDKQMKYAFDALMFDVLEDVIVAIDNAPTIEVKDDG